MWPKWYKVGTTGSFSNPQGYVTTFTVSNNTPAVNKSIGIRNSPTSTISKKRAKKPLKKSKVSDDNKQNQCPDKAVSDEDSELMKQFFKEVRYRELKSYYAKLIAQNRRWPTKSACRICNECGLVKAPTESKDIRHNIYCWGSETMCG